MPSNLITKDGQWQIGNVLIGSDTIHFVGVDGLGVPEPKTRDVDLDLSDGVAFGPDLQSSRSLALTIHVVSHRAATDRQTNVMSTVKTVLAWWPTSSASTVLYGRMPGFGLLSFVGRTRGADVDYTALRAGLVRMQLTFVTADAMIGGM